MKTLSQRMHNRKLLRMTQPQGLFLDKRNDLFSKKNQGQRAAKIRLELESLMKRIQNLLSLN